ncbi:GNAT family N-acetyltransferase [Brevibacillus agri]|uniref:GNAT family N-acetyltransferase n=1 Tax=Brevibacillus agri TaxID=51101 RepID=UPI002E1B38BB|nr:GNAT family N-acetyltransferase [Brevibacillus agri]MED4570041.1 GNAT family N-acetyltransferase [Brevibacillus agri]
MRIESVEGWLVQKNRLELIQDIGSRDMDSKDTLQDFIQWGVDAFPAKKYVLVFWGHGLGAVDGYGGDEAYGHKKMKLPVMQSALHDAYQKTGVKFGLIGFDACKMAGLEVAYALRQYGEYMVAAVDYTNKNGWDYQAVFQTLNQRPDISPVDLAEVIAVSYRNHSLQNQEDEDLQQSVIRLSKVEEVVKEVDLFSKKLVDLLPQPQTFSQLADARNRAENYADEADMVDLADFSAYIGQTIRNDEGAEKIARAVEQAVVSNMKSPEHPKGKGISIYFPAEDKARFQEKADIYQQIDFSPYIQTAHLPVFPGIDKTCSHGRQRQNKRMTRRISMKMMDRMEQLQEEHLAILRTWFQDAEVQKRMEGMEPLEEWYGYVKENDSYFVWIAFLGEQPVGVAMVEIEEEHAGSIGLIVNPSLRHRGYGKALLREAMQRQELSGVQKWIAGIEADNVACLRCFEAAGFAKEEPVPDEDGFFLLVRQ